MARNNNANANTAIVQPYTPTEKVYPKHHYNKVSPITENQILYTRSMEENILTVVRGVAGTGKTFLAAIDAAERLELNQIKKIVLIRPYVHLSNESIGFLPGTEQEKLYPYVEPMLDAIEYVIGPEKLAKYLLDETIVIKALASIRGKSYRDAYLICDEMQGTRPSQIQAVTTRIGKNTKVVIVGDTRQTDVRKGQQNGLDYLAYIVDKYNISKTGLIEMEVKDIQRSGITKEFVIAYEQEGWE